MAEIDARSLLDAVPDAVIVADMDARIVYASRSAAGLLGWSSHELIGQPLRIIQPERMHAAHDAGFERFARGERSQLIGRRVRVPARRRDGSEVEVELNLSEASGRDGERLVVGVLRDLSRRVGLEDQLRVLRYLRATSAATRRLWSRLDPGRVLGVLVSTLADDFDAALARAWLYEPGTRTLRLVASAGPAAGPAGSSGAVVDVSTDPGRLADVARSGAPFVRNGLRGEPELDESWVEREGLEAAAWLPLLAGQDLLGMVLHVSREPLTDEMVELLANIAALASAAVNDSRLVIRQRRALAEARQARERFALLARTSGILAGSLDPAETVQRVARVSVPDLCDWCVVDVADEDTGRVELAARAHRDPALESAIDELRRGYPPAPRHHPIYRAIDEARTICELLGDDELRARARDPRHLQLLRRVGVGSHVVAPLSTRDRIIGAVSFVRGPGREPFDEHAVAAAEVIARRAAVAIDNARLHRAVQEAVDLRDEFLAVASHELRTPLTVVGVHWELLDRSIRRAVAASPEADLVTLNRHRVESTVLRLGEAIRQLRRLVIELLDVNRIQRGTLEMSGAEVDLVALVRRAAQEVPEPKRVHAVLPRRPIVGWWDDGRLRQVLDNLLHNALKYSRPSSQVEVALAQADGVARITVTDTGIGVPPDQREAIFRPFTRGRNVSSRNYPGLGLGLAVSREIVQRSGGRIWVESPGEGAGSTFVVELPVRDAPSEEAAS